MVGATVGIAVNVATVSIPLKSGHIDQLLDLGLEYTSEGQVSIPLKSGHIDQYLWDGYCTVLELIGFNTLKIGSYRSIERD